MTSPTTIDGIVQSVQRVTQGDELTVAAVAGATSLLVDDAIDFDPDGGNLTINGQTAAYTAADDTTGTITLATGLAADAAAGDRVDVTDANAVVLTELRAVVELAESVDNDEALDVPVAHALVPLLVEGVRDPGTGESVRLTLHGDEWVVTDVVARPPQLDGALIRPNTIPSTALSFTVGSTTVSIGTVAPTSPHVDDLWLDGNNGYQVKQWDGASWVPHQLGAAAIANAAITPAQVSFTARDIGGVTTSIGAVAPSTPVAGDLWYDSANGYRLNRYTGTGWTLVQYGTAAIQDASITSAKVSLTARQVGANVTTIAAVAPGGAITGDLWLDTSNGYQLKQYNGATWAAVQFGTAAIQDASITSAKVTLTARQIGANVTTIANAAPGGAIAGDMWIDTSNGNQLKQYTGSAWTVVQFGAAALATASITPDRISFTARDIGGVTTTIGPAPLVGALAGDLWYDSGNGYKLNRYTGSAWVAVQLGTNAIAAGSITAALVAANTITAAQIAAGTITAAQIAAGTITGDRIAAGTITASLIATDSLTAAQIAAGAITASELAAGAVTAAAIAANTITAGQIAANTITAAQIAANTVTAAQIAANTITAAQIAAGTITGDRIAANTITASLIAASTITAAQIAASTITAAQIAAGTITAAQIAAGTITGDRIVAGTLTASLIAAGTITGDRIAAGTITGGLIAAGAIAAGHILAGSISADKLAVGALDAQSITAASIFAGNFTGTIQGTTADPTTIIGALLTDCTVEMDAASGPLLVHGSAGAATVNVYTASASFTPPAGVTSIKVEAWGAGGSGQPGGAGQGGGGGEYARNDSVPVTPGTVYNFTVAGTAVANINNATGTDGGSTTFTGDSAVVVKANGGKGGWSGGGAGYGAGGSGSTAPVHFNGGAAPDSSASNIWSGKGGGGSGGSSRAGNAGKVPAGSSYTGGAGGVAVTDGGAGGKGGDGTDGTGTHPGSAGTAGAVPGGGGGGGSNNQSFAMLNGGNGARGQLRITYTAATPPLLASISPTGGTDQYGNTYPAGIHDAVTAAVQTAAVGTPLNGAGAGGSYAPSTLYYVKDSNDIVTFWGYGWVNAALTANTTYNVAVLPAGYRPASNMVFPSVTSISGQLTGRVQVYASGTVAFIPGTSSTATGGMASITGSYKAGN